MFLSRLEVFISSWDCRTIVFWEHEALNNTIVLVTIGQCIFESQQYFYWLVNVNTNTRQIVIYWLWDLLITYNLCNKQQLSGSSYSLDYQAQLATTTTTTTTRVKYTTIFNWVNLHFTLKDQVSRLCINLKLYLSPGQLVPKSPWEFKVHPKSKLLEQFQSLIPNTNQLLRGIFSSFLIDQGGVL